MEHQVGAAGGLDRPRGRQGHQVLVPLEPRTRGVGVAMRIGVGGRHEDYRAVGADPATQTMREMADRVAVMRDGRMVGMRDIDHTNPEELVSLIVGRKAREIERPAVQDGPEVLRASALRTSRAGPIDLTIRRGEMVGLVGLRGAGHEEIGRALSDASEAYDAAEAGVQAAFAGR